MTTDLERGLKKKLGKAISDFSMIQDGDKIMVCVSGGKDSYTMLYLLRELQKRAPVRFQLKVVTIDQGHPHFPSHILTEFMQREAYDFSLVAENTYRIVNEKIPKGKTSCSLCSRLRRGIIYRLASEWGCTKIALGHHREDVLQTLLLNLFFSGKLGAMPPKLVADKGRHTVIRPLVYCPEAEVAEFARQKDFPIVPCSLCSSQEQKRKVVARLLSDLEEQYPGIMQIMLAATQNVVPSHLLDKRLWSSLHLHSESDEEDNDGSHVTDKTDDEIGFGFVPLSRLNPCS